MGFFLRKGLVCVQNLERLWRGKRGFSHLQFPQPEKTEAQNKGLTCVRSSGRLGREPRAKFRCLRLWDSHNIMVPAVNLKMY